MNDSPILPDTVLPDTILPGDAEKGTENSFLFSDWEIPSEAPTRRAFQFDGHKLEVPQFEGRIIARMPDLGSDCFVKSIEKPRSPSFWANAVTKAISSCSAMINGIMPNSKPESHDHYTRQQFSFRVAAVSCVVVLFCIGIFYFERGEQATEISDNITEAVPGKVEFASNEPVVIREPNGLALPEWHHLTSQNVVATQDVTVAEPPVSVGEPVQSGSVSGSVWNPGSVWNRPAADSYSPSNTALVRSERSEGNPIAVASADSSPPFPVAPSASPAAPPVAQPATVTMTPMIDMSMPVSPHEQQFFAYSGPPVGLHPPVQAPFDPFAQISVPVAPQGMMPMSHHTSAPHHSGHPVPPPVHPQYAPLSAMHPPQGQHNPHMMMPPQMPPPHSPPIPAGPSTLPVQGTPHPQQVPPPSHPGFHHVSPMHRGLF